MTQSPKLQSPVHEPSVNPSPANLQASKHSSLPGLNTGSQTMGNRSQEFIRAEKRGRAKEALQDLSRHHIGYEQISAEKFDPELLRELYLETGLPLPQEASMKSGNNVMATFNQPNAGLSLDSPTNKGRAGDSVTAPETVDVADQSQDQSNSSLANSKPQGPPSTLSAKSTPETALKKPESGITKKTPQSNNSAPSQERKDYIAKLLAAKQAVKQSPSSGPQKSAEPEGITTAPIESSTREITPTKIQQLTDVKKAEPKDPVQTELVRQRLQALKHNHKNHSASVNKPDISSDQTNRSEATSTPILKSLEETLAQVQTNDNTTTVERMDASKGQYFDPSTSFFALSARKPSGGLPGLPGLSSFASTSIATPLQHRQSHEDGSEVPKPRPDLSLRSSSPIHVIEQVISLSDPSRQSPVLLSPPVQVDSETLPPRQFINDATEELPHEIIEQSPAPFLPPPTVKSRPVPGQTPTSNGHTKESRKRAVAADFIESPPPGAKRKRAPSEPIQLVIEVSDDDDEEMPDDLLPNRGTQNAPILISSDQVSQSGGLGSRRDLGEMPPLTNFPTRTGDVLSTLQNVQTPSLAKHEEEIRKMRQKIAEMEQRKKSKQNSGTPNRSDSRSSPATSDLARAKFVENKHQTIENVNEKLIEKEKMLAAKKLEIQKKLEVDRQSQIIINERAEQERQQAAHAATIAERRARLERKAVLEAALPKLDAQIVAAQTKLDKMVEEQKEIQGEIQRGNEGREALLQELKDILKAQESDPSVQQETSSSNSLRKEQSIETTEPPATKVASPSDQLPSDFPFDSPKNQAEVVRVTTDSPNSSDDEGEIHEHMQSPTESQHRVLPDDLPEHDEEYSPMSEQNDDEPEDYEPSSAMIGVASKSMSGDRMSVEEIQNNVVEDYEPSLEVDIISPSPAEQPARTQVEPFQQVQGNVSQVYESDAEHSPSSHSDVSEEGELAEDPQDDTDDYEPPEPRSPVDVSTSVKVIQNAVNDSQETQNSSYAEAMELDEETMGTIPDITPATIDLTEKQGSDLMETTLAKV